VQEHTDGLLNEYTYEIAPWDIIFVLMEKELFNNGETVP